MGRSHGGGQRRRLNKAPRTIKKESDVSGTRNDFATGLTGELAAFVAGSRLEDVPDTVREHGVRAILNGFGTALGGASDQALARLGAALVPFSSGQVASVIGRSHRVDAPTAAFLNAAAINVFDFDDTHEGTIIHPTAPVAPVVLAIAEMRPVSGIEALHAFILGVEVACRLGNAVSPWHYDRGWHITSTCGIFGAAAAAARLLKLDQTQTVWALGNASAQSSGLVETLGFMAKSAGVGAAARNGLLSALMAQAGVEGPQDPIGGPRGFLKVTCDAPKFDRVCDGLGDHWELLRNMFKPYPCGVVLNPVIDACLAARNRPGFDARAIDTIVVRGNPLLKARADRPDVTTGREAQVSAQHAVAVALHRGPAGAADFSDEAMADQKVLELRNKVFAVEVDGRKPIEAAEVEIRFSNGERLCERVDIASGSSGHPLSDAALEEKFLGLAAYGSPQLDIGPLLSRLWKLPALPDVAQLLTHARLPG